MEKSFIKAASVAIALFVAIGVYVPGIANATVDTTVTYTNYSSSVKIIHTGNHYYYEEATERLYKQEVDFLDKVFIDARNKNKLPLDYFTVYITDGSVDNGSEKTLTKEEECYFERVAQYLGSVPCYSASLSSEDVTHDVLVAAVLAAAQLNDTVKSVSLDGPGELLKKYENELAYYRTLESRTDPVFSPNGKLFVQTVWQGGQARFELVNDLTRKSTQLPRLSALPTSSPRWSFNSRFIAYASGKEVMIYDTLKRSIQTIDLAKLSDEPLHIFELVLSFSPKENKLFFAFDQNLFSDYKSYVVNPVTKKVTLQGDSPAIPWFDANYLERRQLPPEPDSVYDTIAIRLSPDSSKMLVTGIERGTGLTKLFLVDKKSWQVTNP